MFLAVPIIALVKILVNDFIDYKIKLKDKKAKLQQKGELVQ